MTFDDFEFDVHRFLALRLERRARNTAEVSMPDREAYAHGAGAVQGGILSALADATAVAALTPDKPFGFAMTSIEFKMNFLRPARIGGGSLLGKARVLRSGKAVAVCEVSILQKDVMIAKGLFTYLYFEPEELR